MIKVKYQGGEVNGNAEGRAGVGNLQWDDSGSGERPSVRESGQEENRNVQEQPEGHDELGAVQEPDGRVRLKRNKPKGVDTEEKNGRTKEWKRVGNLQRADEVVRRGQRGATESGTLQERSEGPDELGAVQSIRDGVWLKQNNHRGEQL